MASSRLNDMPPTKVFPCNTCSLVFDNSQDQRTHMREPWHVYNLKRRMSSLPPISADDYTNNVATSLVSNKPESREAEPSLAMTAPSPEEISSEADVTEERENIEDPVGEHVSVNHCLFCSSQSESLETNLEHMSSNHGLYIPEVEHLASLESILRYLRTVITKYKECLYCGTTKQSVEGIQRHMLDKGHCMINLEREPELLEFWELSDSEEHGTEDDRMPSPQTKETDALSYRDLEEGEYTLSSGKVVISKDKARESRKNAHRTGPAAKEPSTEMILKDSSTNRTGSTSTDPTKSLIKIEDETRNRAITVRDSKGLIGVSDQQIQSLITVHRKMQRQQAIVQAAAGWADELGGRSQKHYKTKMNLRAG